MMNTNYSGIHISRRDYLALPPEMRYLNNGPMVMTTIRGRQTFVPAIIIN